MSFEGNSIVPIIKFDPIFVVVSIYMFAARFTSKLKMTHVCHFVDLMSVFGTCKNRNLTRIIAKASRDTYASEANILDARDIRME